MLIIPPAVYRKRRKIKSAAGPAPVGAFTMVSAVFDSTALTLTLQFSRAINIDDLDGSAISVNDAAGTGTFYAALGEVDFVNPTTVRMGLDDEGPASGSGTRLDATASNGIVAADDGQAWPGVSEYPL